MRGHCHLRTLVHLRALAHLPLWVLIAMPPSCHKKAPGVAPATDPAATALAEADEAIRTQAWNDLQNDLLTLKLQLAVTTSLAQARLDTVPPAKLDAALYTCDRLALAEKQLSGDARAQSAIGEADAVCAYQAPIAATARKLAALESAHAASTSNGAVDCGPIRDIFNRIGSKYRGDATLAALIKRFKSDCPHVHGGGAHLARAPASPVYDSRPTQDSRSTQDAEAAHAACRQRCESTAFSCRASCPYCGSCTSDKTWEYCHATCDQCRSSCEQSEKFCRASCGT